MNINLNCTEQSNIKSYIKGRVHYNGHHYIQTPSTSKVRTYSEQAFDVFNGIVRNYFLKINNRNQLLFSELYNKIYNLMSKEHSAANYLKIYTKIELFNRIHNLLLSEKISESKKKYLTVQERYLYIIRGFLWQFDMKSFSRRQLLSKLRKIQFNADCETIFNTTVKSGLKKDAQVNKFIELLCEKDFKSDYNLDNITFKEIDIKINSQIHNYKHRIKRFTKKVFWPTNNFNYFVTFTYDDEKQTEQSFKQGLFTCLKNLSVRYGWKCIIVPERGEESVTNNIESEGRLHYHGLISIPKGQEAGDFISISNYSKKKKCQQQTINHSLFYNRFGLCEFVKVTDEHESGLYYMLFDKLINYIKKYMFKTGFKMRYSRHLITDILKELPETEKCSTYMSFIEKIVLHDDVTFFFNDKNELIYNSPRIQV